MMQRRVQHYRSIARRLYDENYYLSYNSGFDSKIRRKGVLAQPWVVLLLVGSLVIAALFTIVVGTVSISILSEPGKAAHARLSLPDRIKPQRNVKAKAASTRKITVSKQKPLTNQDFTTAFGPDGVEYHMIFSTGCSTFQDWQSYVFFFHAWKSGQVGHVTRIASGCSDENAQLLQQLHQEQIDIMSPGRFHLHITPEYSRIKPGINFKYFNKPFGVRHWLEHVLGYPDNHDHDNAIIMLLDPDQIVLRPFTKDFTNSTEVWAPTSLNKFTVEHGVPFGQTYGFGAQWKVKVNMQNVAPNEVSPVDELSVKDARIYYAAGPPYIATGRDMYSIVTKWTEFVPRVHDDYPHLLAEMFAYCVAAAHLKLPHQMAQGFMVSDTTSGTGEGWKLVDHFPKNQVCQVPKDQLPHVLHYCQRYGLGKWYIGKYRLRKDFISCESDLLMEPPIDVAVQYNFGVTPTNELKYYKHANIVKRHAFMLCMLIKALNDAAIFYKQHHCPDGTANFAKVYTFHKSMTVEQTWFDKAKVEAQKSKK
jgi:hypothetical protein